MICKECGKTMNRDYRYDYYYCTSECELIKYLQTKEKESKL